MGIVLAFGCDSGSDTGSSGPASSDSDIFVARSVDGGATWSAPAALNVDAGADLGSDAEPQLTTDGQGAWASVWRSSSFSVPVRTDYDILVARSADDEGTWVGQAELNSYAGSDADGDYSPQLTYGLVGVGGQPTWIATWQSWHSLGDTLGTDADILMARSTDDGATWTAAAALNENATSDTGHDALPQLTTDGQGLWIAVWRSGDSLGNTIGGIDFDILLARSTDGGDTWTDPAALNTNAASDECKFGGEGDLLRCDDDEAPQLTTDGAGTWVAVWEYWGPRCRFAGCLSSIEIDLRVSRSTDAGATWSPPAALNTNAAGDIGDDTAPQVTYGRVGVGGQPTWVAVWQSKDRLGAAKIGQDADILMSRSTDGGATWTDPAALNTNAASDLSSGDTSPQLTTDGQGNWVAVWRSLNSLGDTIGSDADILFARSTDGGVTWTDPAALNTNAPSDDLDDRWPQLTTNGAGTWIAVWQSGNPF
jgi:Neuraminidase (sialidase)